MAKKKTKYDVDIENEIISTVKKEKTSWDEETVFVTDKVAFLMRNLIKNCRKNYWGIFKNQRDPITGRKKTWVPLTEWLVETTVKNTDMDSKDLNFRAKIFKAIGLTSLVRSIVKHWVDENFFGEDLDEMERQLAIDGTIVWKTWEEDGKMVKEGVDLLNFYIDPTAKSIQKTPATIERAVITAHNFFNMDEWWKKEDAKIQTGIHPTDSNLSSFNTSETRMVEIWERWGLMPKSWITGKKKDKDKMIEGHIVLSNLENQPVVHYVAENKKKDTLGNVIKPYEEAWLKRVPGRWYGKGIPEIVLQLQTWINIIVNIRINRAFVSQLGIWKIKRGKQITPSMVKKLASNGAILVQDMDDIEQLTMEEASVTSYKDEETIIGWAQRITSAFEIVTGEQMPASMPATTSALQMRSAQSAFVLIKEGIGFFLQRWLKRHALPILSKNIKKGDIQRISGSFEEMRELDERVVNHMVYKQLEEMTNAGHFIDPFDVQREKIRAVEKLRKMGDDKFTKILQNINFTEYDVQFYITNEEIDKTVLVRDLISLVSMVPQYGDIIVRQVMDIMGVDINQFEEAKRQVMSQQGSQGQVQGQEAPQGPPQAPQGGIKPPGGEAGGLGALTNILKTVNAPGR